MASFQRVALFILFDAMESDIVSKIRSVAAEDILLTEEETYKAARRLAGREDFGYDIKNPFDLLYGLDLGEKYQVLLRHKREMSAADREYYSKLADRVVRAIPIRNHVMHGRQLTVNEHIFALDFAHDLLRHKNHWPTLSETYAEYTNNPASFIERSVTFLDDPTYSEVLNNLPVPDYDDTGFLPRPTLESDLKKKLIGRHPVITVLGEGGNGKTALALRVLYGLVQSSDHDFDAIVWVSAKSSELSVGGIREIESAVTDAVELMSQAAAFEPGSDVPGDRLRRMLAQNKVLLVVDNYETVRGDDFSKLAEDVPGDSKLLFTSRAPIGGDLTVLVNELPRNDALIYFRRLVQAYAVESLRTLKEDRILDLLDRLNHKPLLIKWLVLGVKSGLDPDRITMSPETALRFCLDNVILTLGAEAQAVIVVLASLPSPATASVIQHVSRLSALQVGDGIAELSRFGLVDVLITDTAEKAYAVKQFSRAYISRLIRPKAEIVESITKNYNAIDSEFRTTRTVAHHNPYSMKSFKVQSRSQMILAKKLKLAASMAIDGRFEFAEELVAEAKTLDPTYFENYRVESFVAQQQNDWSRALSAMEAAISLAPEEPQLHFYAGGLLLRLSDNDRAAEYLARARELDPNENMIVREIARNEMIRCNFDAAEEAIRQCDQLRAHTDKDHVIALDLEIQLLLRKAEFYARTGEGMRGLASIRDLMLLLQGLDRKRLDERMIRHIARADVVLRMLDKLCGESDMLREFRDYVSSAYPAAGIEGASKPLGMFRGRLRESGRTDTFGFLVGNRGVETFVHRKCATTAVWNHMLAGAEVAFDVEPFEGRERACNLSITDTVVEREPAGLEEWNPPRS
jgi:LuxR family transcriptional regulator, glucitol operon activator